jgi:hypothetical protein
MNKTIYREMDDLIKEHRITDVTHESWSPSTNSEHADQLFEQFDNISIAKTPGLNGTSDYICKIYSPMLNRHIRVISSTKSLAICLAALEAHGVNTSHLKGRI